MSQKSILLVDDEEELRKVLKMRLERNGFAIFDADSGEAAQEIFKKENIDLVVSDVRMGGMSGIELLEWVKKENPKPFLLMSGFSDIQNTDQALRIGAEGFLPKPFKLKDLLDTIDEVISHEDKGTTAYREEDFRPVSISTFLSDCEIPFHVFLRVTNAKFVKIAYSGEDISESRLRTYKEKGVKFLYLKREDHSRFLGFELDISKGVVRDSNIPRETKKEFVEALGESVFEKITFETPNIQEVEEAGEFLQTATEAIVDSDDVFESLDNLMENHDYLYGHCLSVSVLAFLTAKKFGITSPAELFNISVAGLMHDMAKAQWPEKLAMGEEENISPAQKTMIENHPIRAAEILQSYNSFPKAVVEIVRNHHEKIDGSGGPRGIKKEDLSVATQIVGLADMCVNLQYQSKKLNRDHKLILRQKAGYQKEYDPEVFQALLDVFGFAPLTEDKKVVA